jgi:hypothetical protein
MSATHTNADAQTRAVYLRVFGGDLGAAPLWVDAAVLDRYRGRAGWRVLRTNTVGRVQSPEGWSLDFGIADAERLLHASVSDIAQRVPAAEREHWAQHLVTPAVSRNFLTMRLVPGSCIDDGDLRAWDA